MSRPYQSSKAHVATLREFPTSRSGKPYFKGRFGDAVVFLFREDTPYRTEGGRDYYDWNLVIGNDYNVIRGYRDPGLHHEDDANPVTDADKAARGQQGSTRAVRARRGRTDRGR